MAEDVTHGDIFTKDCQQFSSTENFTVFQPLVLATTTAVFS